MSLTRSPLRSALLPVLWPPTAQRPGGGAAPPAPGSWVPIQQMPGWDITYAVPLNPATEDTGFSWAGVDHAITGLDSSIYIVSASVQLPDAINMPARIRVPEWADTVVTPGAVLQLALIMLQDGSTTFAQHFNQAPPTNAFDGAPFEFQLNVPRQGATPATANFDIVYTPPNILNDGEEGTIALRFGLEVDLGAGFVPVQGVAGFSVSGATYADGEFSASGITDTTASGWAITINSDLADIPVRITVLEYSETPGAPPGSKTAAASLRTSFFVGSGDTFESSMDYPQSWPTNGFTGSPYVGAAPANVTPANPGTAPTLNLQMLGCVYDNADVAGVVMNYDIAVEVQIPE